MHRTFIMMSLLAAVMFAGRVYAAEDGPALARLRAQLPVPGRVLIDDEDPAALTASLPANDTSEIITDDSKTAPPSGKALRMHISKATDPVWAAQMLSGKSLAQVHKGDVILFSCWMRAPEAAAGTTGVTALRLQLDRAPWPAPVDDTANCGPEWKPVYKSGVADRDFAAGSLQVTMHIGQQHQVLDVADLVVVDLGPGMDVAKLPYNRVTWPGMEANAPWRAEAQKRIERFRMTDLAVSVTDAAGQPVPNAQVHVQEQRRAFGFGSFVDFGGATPALLANSPDGEKVRATFLRLFNRATCPIYWVDNWGWPNKKREYLGIAKWLHDHDYLVRGHVMIYPTFHFMPAEAEKLKDDPAKLQARILRQIDEIGQATLPYGFREYDVTNELRGCTDITKILGRDAVADWYAQARRAVPNAKMALNENTLLTSGGMTKANQDTYLDWYRLLKSHGQAPDVLGFQSHFSEGFTSPEMIWSILDRFAKETDAELQITEFDINTLDEDAQAGYTRDFMTACFAHPRITGFTMWGFWEGSHWIPKAAFYRKDWSIKPNGKVLEELLTKTWWTDTTVNTGPDGHATVKGFLGTYKVSVTAGGKTVVKDVPLERAGEPVSVGMKLE